MTVFRLILLGLALLCGQAEAESWATKVLTPTKARYAKTTDYYIFSKVDSYTAFIPDLISVGDPIIVTYKTDDGWEEDLFEVHRITFKDDFCRLHNFIPMKHSHKSGDTIYVDPCKILEKE